MAKRHKNGYFQLVVLIDYTISWLLDFSPRALMFLLLTTEETCQQLKDNCRVMAMALFGEGNSLKLLYDPFHKLLLIQMA